jgi:seryl-tRNA synthetase
MLRQRGADPAAVLKDFRDVDTQRRQAITEAETMKAQRNKASEDIAKLKKAGQDATAAIAETKDLREQIQEREKTATDLDARLQDISRAFPTCRTKACRWGIARKRMWKSAAGARRRSLTSLPSRIGIWAQSSECSTWNAR